MDILRGVFSAVSRRNLSIAVPVAVLLAATGCGSSDATTSPSSSVPFTQIDLVVGTGTTATLGNTLRVSYTGWLYDAAKTNGKGAQFDTNASFSFVLGVSNVIQGWHQGIAGMRVGGQRRLTIPPELAYGSGGSPPSIPGNASLVFDITLLSVQ